MGFIGGLLGTSSGDTGAAGGNFSANGVPILSPVTVDQAHAAQSNADTGLANQGALLQALQGQGGIQNQSQVYGQLQGIANGTGPNPAAAQLAQATAANTANQAALMAGQRGANSNAGLIARQAAMQGAANQQNSIGQAASLQAQQQANAINAAGNLATNQVGQQTGATNAYTSAAQGEQGQLLNSIAAQNNAAVGMQSNQNSTNASIANNVASGQQGFAGGVLGGVGSALGLAHGGVVKPKVMMAAGGVITPTAPMAAPSIQITTNGQPASTVAQQGPLSNAGQYLNGGGGNQTGAAALQQGMSSLGKGIGSQFGSGEGEEEDVDAYDATPTSAAVSGPLAGAGDDLASAGEVFAANGGSIQQLMQMAPLAVAMMSRGGNANTPVPARVSPGERYLAPKDVAEVAEGKKPAIKAGEKIPGKAKVKGDSLKNDTVPKTLQEGGIVLPRSVMNAKDPAKEASKFVAACLAKQGLRKK